MSKKFTVNNTIGYIHTFKDKTVYAINCDLNTIEILLNKLYEQFNKVTLSFSFKLVTLSRITLKASLANSLIYACSTPRDKASKDKAPLPPKRSNTIPKFTPMNLQFNKSSNVLFPT